MKRDIGEFKYTNCIGSSILEVMSIFKDLNLNTPTVSVQGIPSVYKPINQHLNTPTVSVQESFSREVIGIMLGI